MIIPLTQQSSAIVDTMDYDHLLMLKWHARWDRTGKAYYAVHTYRIYDDSHKDNGCGTIRMHRLIMENILGRKLLPHEQVDHKDGNTLNNQRDNLRLCTTGQNCWNAKKQTLTYAGNKPSSGYKGVTKHFKRGKSDGWVAQIRANNIHYYLGFFKSEEDAARAYDRAAKQLHGDFARINAI